VLADSIPGLRKSGRRISANTIPDGNRTTGNASHRKFNISIRPDVCRVVHAIDPDFVVEMMKATKTTNRLRGSRIAMLYAILSLLEKVKHVRSSGFPRVRFEYSVDFADY
jgi:hypothetical protein